MSAESGVPTYRGQGGVWKEYDYRKYATQYAFDEDPDRVWRFHNERRTLLSGCEPNDGHRIIARLENEREHVTVVTQNIDGLHQLAGTDNIIELHGNLWRSRCATCGEKMESRDAPLAALNHASCGGWWRPDIVWFGDVLSQANIDAARREMKACEVFVSIGTSAAVYPAAELPLVAKEYGAAHRDQSRGHAAVARLRRVPARHGHEDAPRAPGVTQRNIVSATMSPTKTKVPTKIHVTIF